MRESVPTKLYKVLLEIHFLICNRDNELYTDYIRDRIVNALRSYEDSVHYDPKYIYENEKRTSLINIDNIKKLRAEALSPQRESGIEPYLIIPKHVWESWLYINSFPEDHPKEAWGYKIYISEDK